MNNNIQVQPKQEQPPNLTQQTSDDSIIVHEYSSAWKVVLSPRWLPQKQQESRTTNKWPSQDNNKPITLRRSSSLHFTPTNMDTSQRQMFESTSFTEIVAEQN